MNMTTMTTRKFIVRFDTPGFLGDASQVGAWRTPPFKSLLRQWWRVAWAARERFSVDMDRMRRDEGHLFGAAADSRANRSLVRVRLDSWSQGTLRAWEEMQKVNHPEVKFPIDCGLYLGYGPVVLPKGQRKPKLKNDAAINAQEFASLSFAFPEDETVLVDAALGMMNRYGTLGGRSRNGWGSITLTPADDAPLGDIPKSVFRDWREALGLDWPHAIGLDESGPLVWQTDPMDDWKSVMRRLAEIKIEVRTRFSFPNSPPPHPEPLPRHWLSYPVTKHDVKSWGRNARLPNSLRFKVRIDGGGKYRGVIFHIPCRPPPRFRPQSDELEAIWCAVHQSLDKLLIRIPE